MRFPRHKIDKELKAVLGSSLIWHPRTCYKLQRQLAPIAAWTLSANPILPLSVKRENIPAVFTEISTVIRKDSQEEEVESKRWQIESLVTCVPRLLQIEVTFPITGRPTVETRDTIVHSATSHLGELNIWRPTSSFTLGRNHTSAHRATTQPIMFLVWESTFWNT